MAIIIKDFWYFSRTIFDDVWRYLKLVSAIFYQDFIFRQMIALQKLWKMFLFHLKSSFRSRNIQVFVVPSFPLFLPVNHCFRAWSKVNLRIYDVFNCLAKNTFCSISWEGKIYGIEIFSIDRVLNKEQFYGKIMPKMCTKS